MCRTRTSPVQRLRCHLGQSHAQRLPRFSRLVYGHICRFDDGNLLDVATDGGHRRDHGVDPAGVDASDVERTVALVAGCGELGLRLALDAADVEEQIGADDVEAAFEQSDSMVEVGHERVVEDGVGVQGDQRVDVGGGEHSGVGSTAQRSGVCACLVLRVGVDTYQFESGIVEDASQAELSHLAGGPLNDTQLAHRFLRVGGPLPGRVFGGWCSHGYDAAEQAPRTT